MWRATITTKKKITTNNQIKTNHENHTQYCNWKLLSTMFYQWNWCLHWRGAQSSIRILHNTPDKKESELCLVILYFNIRTMNEAVCTLCSICCRIEFEKKKWTTKSAFLYNRFLFSLSFSLEETLALRFHYYCIFANFQWIIGYKMYVLVIHYGPFFSSYFHFNLFCSFLLPWITNHLKQFASARKSEPNVLANKICANPFRIIILQHSFI